MEIFKIDVLKKNLKDFKNKILLKYYNAVIVKKLHVDFGISHFYQVINIVEKNFAKSAKKLI